MAQLTLQAIWSLLEEIKDPEIPVVSVVEMGMVQAVELKEDRVIVRLTPTFSGCPALQMIQADIRQRLLAGGAAQVEIETALSPAWSSDWITPAARRKLQDFGIAPPHKQADLQQSCRQICRQISKRRSARTAAHTAPG